MNISLARITRIFFGLLALSSVAFEIVVLLGEGAFRPVNFFSYYTVLSNLLAGVFLIYFGVTNNTSNKTAVVRGAITLYMAMTGVIFAVLLAGLEGVRLTAVPWNNFVLHYIMPLVVVGDWLLSPPKKKISTRAIWLWITFPLLYVVYSLIRGAIVNWYPYPFLNPVQSSYLQVAITSLVLAVFVIALAFAIRQFAGMRDRKKR